MTTKELLLQQIEQLDEEELDALFAWVQQFLEQKTSSPDDDFLVRLGDIQIDGPEDFAENLDLYLSGEKSLDAHLR
ncbi:MAG: hypothetical protein K1X50_09055 [Candidatus Promineofilum sp.]|nr:hypothetical protein [Promineifilum sp.]MCW5865431.1 hypothetical protein [Anaerolineae bacterium]